MQFWYIIEESTGGEWIVTGEKPEYSSTPDKYGQHWTSGINSDWYSDDDLTIYLENAERSAKVIILMLDLMQYLFIYK